MLKENDYRDYCARFNRVFAYLESVSLPKNDVAMSICALRGYYPERMSGILQKADFLFVKDEEAFSKLRPVGSDLGLFTSEGNFLLKGRFIFPVRDMLGNVIALIGWYPDEKKYITTPSRLFSKNCLFYGLEQMSSTGIGKRYVLVEGIFDSLSVRSLGIPCVAQMGISSSRYKKELYSLFKSFIAIPDNDTEGRKVLYEDKWSLPSGSKYLKWVGDSSKDIDKLVNSYEEEDLLQMFKNAFFAKERVYTVKL